MKQDIDKLIEEVSNKYSYDTELQKTLKRIVPVMVKGKSEEVASLLYDTLKRTKIFIDEEIECYPGNEPNEAKTKENEVEEKELN